MIQEKIIKKENIERGINGCSLAAEITIRPSNPR
jgi:hypothetical protein